ncbi:PAS/PAC sensor signal transduction histidine kinase [Methanobacterium lacus]|uniref:histidine kinase n=1 Tax=Methanobacterium lacus (strain AL-21) TaxID=877455 RepID=F0T8J4_METLA|nr:PAS domain S-box protein [Methanobacterium lacus]ADZ09745.1 PAS/PAC sensor signal transduction histidine kinase [Methanobacterium lacus]
MTANSDGSCLKITSTNLFLESVMDIIREPLIVLDANLRVITFNDPFSNYFNVDPSDTVGNLIYDINNGEWDSPDLRRLLEDILPESPPIKDFEMNHFFENGTPKILNLNAQSFECRDQKPMILISINDITEHKLTIEKLQESEKHFQAVQKNSLDRFTILKPVYDDQGEIVDFSYIYQNAQAAKSTGRNSEEIIGLRMTELWPTFTQTNFFNMYKEAVNTQEVVEFEEHYSSDGIDDWFYATVTPIPDGIAISIQIVTDHKKAQEKLVESKEKLNTLFENLSVGISVIDNEGKVIYENPALERILGLSETELKLGKYGERKYYNSDYSEIPPDELPSSRAFEEQTPIKDIEVGVLIDNNNMIWTNVSAIPLSFPDWKMLLVTYDITKSKKVEEKLQESYERFNLAQKVSNIGTFEWNIQTGVNIWTPELEAIYGLKEGEFPGTQGAWEELVHPDDKQKAINGVDIALKTGEPTESEFRVKWADGSVHWLLGRWQVIKGDDGELLKLIGINVDITALKEYEFKQQNLLENEKELTNKLHISNQELEKVNIELIHQQDVQNRLIRKLEVSNKELEQFAYVASHDLQEPLRMVTSFTQLLAMKYKDKLDSDADDYIEFIVEGSHRMKDLIDDLLAYSRLNTEKTEYQFSDLNQLLDNVLLGMKNTIVEEGVQITRDELPTVRCDSSQLGQVFQNLISNSIKFHKTNPKIHISAEETREEWIVGVSDEGIGIDPEHQQQIFDVFKRLHSRKKYPGTGIGLSICKRVVERHNGKIWVESELGYGSSFYFTLPKKAMKLNQSILEY